MDLPAELWTYILELTYGMDVYPGGYNDFGTAPEMKKPLVNGKVVTPPTKAILLLNKTINKAIKPFVLHDTCKCFKSAYKVESHLMFMHENASPLQNLRVLELDFSNLQYFYMFGV